MAREQLDFLGFSLSLSHLSLWEALQKRFTCSTFYSRRIPLPGGNWSTLHRANVRNCAFCASTTLRTTSLVCTLRSVYVGTEPVDFIRHAVDEYCPIGFLDPLELTDATTDKGPCVVLVHAESHTQLE